MYIYMCVCVYYTDWVSITVLHGWNLADFITESNTWSRITYRNDSVSSGQYKDVSTGNDSWALPLHRFFNGFDVPACTVLMLYIFTDRSVAAVCIRHPTWSFSCRSFDLSLSLTAPSLLSPAAGTRRMTVETYIKQQHRTSVSESGVFRNFRRRWAVITWTAQSWKMFLSQEKAVFLWRL